MLNRIDDRLTDKGSKLAKTPLKYFTEFLKRHVLSSVTTNSSEDVLGRFYGEFIRYSGGGWAVVRCSFNAESYHRSIL